MSDNQPDPTQAGAVQKQGRKMPKLTLDSEEEERIQEEQKAREEDKRIRKDEKRKRKEEAQKLAEIRSKEKQQQEQNYLKPEKMFDEDSNSNNTFSRVEHKIKKTYPNARRRDEFKKNKRRDSSSQQSQSSSEELSQQTPEKNKKIKPENKVKVEKNKQRKHSEEEQSRKIYKPKDKITQQKQQLAEEVALRWWYVLPEWPPQNYDYESALKKQGYRIVNASDFRMQEDVIGGLHKATPLDGYVGAFKSKNKLIDVRPKEIAPTMNFFQTKTKEELLDWLKKALSKQVEELKNATHKQNGEKELINDLQKRLAAMS